MVYFSVFLRKPIDLVFIYISLAMELSQVLETFFTSLCWFFGIEIFKVKFVAKKYQNLLKFCVSIWHFLLWIFTGIFITLTFSSAKVIKINVLLFIHIVQTCFPGFIMMIVVFKAFKYQQHQEQNYNELRKIDKHLEISLSSNHRLNNQSKRIFFFITKLFLVSFSKIVKLYLLRSDNYSVISSCSTLIPDIICSANDFLFVFHVQHLTNQIKYLNSFLRTTRTVNAKRLLKVEKMSNKILNCVHKLNSFYSTYLLCSIVYHFLSLTLCFYWLFVRIVYHHLKSIRNYLNYFILINVQLLFSFGTVYNILVFCATSFKFYYSIFIMQ